MLVSLVHKRLAVAEGAAHHKGMLGTERIPAEALPPGGATSPSLHPARSMGLLVLQRLPHRGKPRKWVHPPRDALLPP